MTDSNELKGPKKVFDGRALIDDGGRGSRHHSEDVSKNIVKKSDLEDLPGDAGSEDNVDNLPLDDDPRVVIGLNRFIEAVVKAARAK